MKRFLIVNADDCNLTRGVSEAILDCHDHGILSSTTFMANLPIESSLVREIKKRKKLGLGIHLNVTLGEPVLNRGLCASLISEDGRFKKYAQQTTILPEAGELFSEYQAQVELFRKTFGMLPTHFDTHHQLHNVPAFLVVLLQLAAAYRRPIRRSCLMSGNQFRGLQANVKTPDHFLGNLSAEGYWRKVPLETILRHLPVGISEIMCHPGKNDKDLRAVSSFREGREVEWELIRRKEYRELLKEQGVTLTTFKAI